MKNYSTKLTEFEASRKEEDLKNITVLDEKIRGVTKVGNEILGILGSDIPSMLPNTSITIKNKLNELARLFKEKNLYLYNNPDNLIPFPGVISWSIIVKDIKSLTDEYSLKFYQYGVLLHEIQSEVLGLEEVGLVKKTAMGYEMIKSNKNLIDVCLSSKTLDDLKKVVSELCEIDKRIFTYSVESNLTLSILEKASNLIECKDYAYLNAFLFLVFSELRDLDIPESEIYKIKEKVTKRYISSLPSINNFSR